MIVLGPQSHALQCQRLSSYPPPGTPKTFAVCGTTRLNVKPFQGLCPHKATFKDNGETEAGPPPQRRKDELKQDETEELKVGLADVVFMSWMKLDQSQKAWSVLFFIVFLYLLPRLVVLVLVVLQRTVVNSLLVLEEAIAASLLKGVFALSGLAMVSLVGVGVYLFLLKPKRAK